MAAYFIAQYVVTDPKLYREYQIAAGRIVQELAQRSIAQSGEAFPLGDVEPGPGHEGAQGLAALVGVEGHAVILAFSGMNSDRGIFRNPP